MLQQHYHNHHHRSSVTSQANLVLLLLLAINQSSTCCLAAHCGHSATPPPLLHKGYNRSNYRYEVIWLDGVFHRIASHLPLPFTPLLLRHPSRLIPSLLLLLSLSPGRARQLICRCHFSRLSLLSSVSANWQIWDYSNWSLNAASTSGSQSRQIDGSLANAKVLCLRQSVITWWWWWW